MKQIELRKIFYDEKIKKYPSKNITTFIENCIKLYDTNINNTLCFGDHILYEIKDSYSNTISYPKVGLFLDYNIVDMSISYEIVHPIRRWEMNFNKNMQSKGYLHLNSEISDIVEYGDDIIIITKIWKQRPSWKEMLKEYKKTLYFMLDRKEKIHRMLNQENNI
jgi:hypothetical protein